MRLRRPWGKGVVEQRLPERLGRDTTLRVVRPDRDQESGVSKRSVPKEQEGEKGKRARDALGGRRRWQLKAEKDPKRVVTSSVTNGGTVLC